MNTTEETLFNGTYDLPEVETVEVEVKSHGKENFDDLSPYEKIKLAATQHGITIKEPKKNCKKCYGRGYVSVQSDTKIPNACKCIFDKNDMKLPYNQPVLTRKDRRNHQKLNKK